MQQTIQTLEQQRFLVKLLGYDYSVEYKLGSSNKVANVLSRKSLGDHDQITAITPVKVEEQKTFFLLSKQIVDLPAKNKIKIQ